MYETTTKCSYCGKGVNRPNYLRGDPYCKYCMVLNLARDNYTGINQLHPAQVRGQLIALLYRACKKDAAKHNPESDNRETALLSARIMTNILLIRFHGEVVLTMAAIRGLVARGLSVIEAQSRLRNIDWRPLTL